MSERRFSAPRETMRSSRDQFERVERVISASRSHQRHDRRHPGRISAIMAEAYKYLQQAEWFLTAIPDDKESFADKGYLVGFENTLRLAHKCMVMAVMDDPIMQGEDRKQERRKGAEAVNQKTQEENIVARLICSLAKRADFKPSELWPELIGDMDIAGLHPRETTKPKQATYEGCRKPLTYEAFRKAINRHRDTAKR